MQTCIAELEQQLLQERQRSALLESELQVLRAAQASNSLQQLGEQQRQEAAAAAGAACCLQDDAAVQLLLPGSSRGSLQQQHEQQQHSELLQQVLLPMQQLHLEHHRRVLQQQQQHVQQQNGETTTCSSSSSSVPVTYWAGSNCQQQQQQPLVPAGGSDRSAASQTSDGQTSGQSVDQVVLTRAEHELLLLKVRAMDAVKEGITIADCSKPDMPLMYVNMGFCRITGYSLSEVLYKNCRFLQVGLGF
jgi:hypothetical protein